MSRLVYKQFVFNITITGTNTNVASPLLQQGAYGPRANPILAVTSSEQMTINNDTLTQAPVSQYWNALMHYHNNFENRFGQGSLTPSELDQFQNYSDGNGSARNPLAGYGDNSMDNTRGGYSGMVVNTNPLGGVGPFTATITLTVTEPIHLSPFVADCGSNFTSGFVGIQNMAYTATLGDLSRVFSVVQDQNAPGVVSISSVVANLSAASLLFQYLTPDPVEPIPRQLSTNYFSLVSYPTRSTAIIQPAGAVSLTMQAVQVTSIPRRMYIFARRDDSFATAYTSDSFFAVNPAVNPLTVTWNNNQFFSQATSMDLYNMSAKNGLNQSWSQWSNYQGSVMCIDFGTDLGLMSDQAPGSLGNYQLGLTCQFVNQNLIGLGSPAWLVGTTYAARATVSYAGLLYISLINGNIGNVPNASPGIWALAPSQIAPTLYVVLVYEGAFDIIDGACSHNIGILTHNDIMNAKENPMVTYKKVESVFGGDFFSSLKNFFGNTLPNAAKRVLPVLGDILPGPYGQIAKIANKVIGGRKRRRGGVLAHDMYGGRRLGAKKLRGGALSEQEDESNEITEDEYKQIKEEIEQLDLSREESIELFNEAVKEINKELNKSE